LHVYTNSLRHIVHNLIILQQRNESSDSANKNQTEVNEEYRNKLLENRRIARQQQQQQQPFTSATTNDVIEMKVNISDNTDQVSSTSELVEDTTQQVELMNIQHERDECRREQQLQQRGNTEQQQQQQQRQQQQNESEDIVAERFQSSPEQEATRDEKQIHTDEERYRENKQVFMNMHTNLVAAHWINEQRLQRCRMSVPLLYEEIHNGVGIVLKCVNC